MNNAHLILTLLAVLGILPGCATLGTSADGHDEISDAEAIPLTDLLAQGDVALRSGDLDAAQVSFALAVERDPSNLDALYKLGVIHYEKGGLKVAEGLLRSALALDPVHQGSREALGVVLLKQERLDEAGTILWDALESRPDSWQAMNALGVIADMDSRHADARELFTAALQVVSRSAKVTNNLGYSYYLSGDYEAAERHFRDATSYDPSYVHAWSNLALLYSRTKRHRESRAAFDKIGSASQAANNLGYLGLLENDATLARRELERAIRLSPSYYDIANQNLAALGDVRAPSVTAVRSTAALVPETSLPRGDSSAASPMTVPENVPANRASPLSKRRRDARRRVAPMLTFVGFAAGGEDDRALQESVRRFQEAYGLAADGHVGLRTRQVLWEVTVTQVQRRLAALGYDVGDVDGRLGRQTRAAIRDFQRRESLKVSGEPDSATVRRIGAAIVRADRQLDGTDRPDHSARG